MKRMTSAGFALALSAGLLCAAPAQAQSLDSGSLSMGSLGGSSGGKGASNENFEGSRIDSLSSVTIERLSATSLRVSYTNRSSRPLLCEGKIAPAELANIYATTSSPTKEQTSQIASAAVDGKIIQLGGSADPIASGDTVTQEVEIPGGYKVGAIINCAGGNYRETEVASEVPSLSTGSLADFGLGQVASVLELVMGSLQGGGGSSDSGSGS